MEIILNDHPFSLEEGCLVVDLLKSKQCKLNMTAVWLNGRQLLMAEYDTTPLVSGDKVKLIRLFGGG